MGNSQGVFGNGLAIARGCLVFNGLVIAKWGLGNCLVMADGGLVMARVGLVMAWS